MKKVIGFSMLAVLFLALIVLVFVTLGIKQGSIVLLSIIALIVFIAYACYLIDT